MLSVKVLRATETWQQAGAYYVRIQAMAREHHITLRQEFDEHDGPDTKYIVLLDEEFPVATCRMYEMDESSVMVGRVVVLPEYQKQGLGRLAMEEAEKWIREQGYQKIVLESRDVAVGFYEKLGYKADFNRVIEGETFTCVYMEKCLEMR
ncbi:MAG: GNAT family N-acetyltransferase [Lachnospiraceae bacterium]|nr:GNAT family N-acetyltransferase [Lachnospiraceae bacterium]